ncbi:MAG: pyocin knob domain-containing protein [Muribaculaceae bacterium]|nr:pyocin knob domain-containing protein [Muribaculaceae bacterium]
MAEAKVLSNTVLKGILTDLLWLRGTCVDMDVVTQTGIFSVQNTTQNLPSGAYQWGFLFQFYYGSSLWMQIYIPHHSDLYVRIRYNAMTSVWRKLSSTST